MEIILLGIYSFFVWLIFIKLKWLPWNTATQVIVVIIPVIGMAALILLLNIFAPSSSDVRVYKYTVPIVSQVRGRVIEVPIEEGNRLVKKGEVLFRIDPTPYQLDVNILEAQLVNAQAGQRELKESSRGAAAKIDETRGAIAQAASRTREVQAKLALARKRAEQYRELVKSGAGNRFDLERAETDVSELEGQLAAARGMLEADLAAVDLACSRFRPDSEIFTLDRALAAAGGVGGAGDGPAAEPVEVSPLLAEAVAVALRAARLTDGDVDPTVGAAMNAVGYDRDFSLVQPEGPAVKLTVRAVPGWRQVELDEQARLLRVPPGIRLDLGATAKAWAADRSAARIAAGLGCGALVSLGGDIAVSGQPPAGGWRVRVQDITGRPEDPPAGPSTVVAIHAGGLATSSTAARRWRRGGDVLHHILDPRTGLPAAPVWRTVSVAAASCTDANIASTAAIIRGRAAPAWLTGLGLPARLVDEAGRVRTVGGWPAETGSTP